jgi:hypothetical protein
MPQVVFVSLVSVRIVVCHQCYWRRALGDLSKIRMLTPCKRNTRRIGSLQSPSRAPVGEVIGVAVVVDDGQLRSGGDKQEASNSEDSS